jgi:hypothetical protein
MRSWPHRGNRSRHPGGPRKYLEAIGENAVGEVQREHVGKRAVAIVLDGIGRVESNTILVPGRGVGLNGEFDGSVWPCAGAGRHAINAGSWACEIAQRQQRVGRYFGGSWKSFGR